MTKVCFSSMSHSEKEIDSDNLFNIEIADENKQESLMAIDTGSAKDNLISIFFFFVLIISTAFAELYSSPMYSKQRVGYQFDNAQNQVLKFPIRSNFPHQFSPFFVMELSFFKSNEEKASNIEISFRYLLIYKAFDGTEIRRESSDYSTFIGMFNSTNSDTIPFIFKHHISFSQIDVRIDFDKSYDFEKAIVDITEGNHWHLVYQFINRITCIISTFCLLLFFYFRLKEVDQSQWLFEQRLTIVLLLLSIACFNPFYFLTFYFPSVFFDFLSSFLTNILTCFVLLFILIILDNVRLGNQISSKYMNLPKFIFCIFQFIVEVCYPLMFHNIVALRIEGFPHNIVNIVEKTRMAFAVAYTIWFLVLVFKGFKQIDSTQRLKMFSYTIVFLEVVAMYFADVFLVPLPFIQNLSKLFSLKLFSAFALGILMVYFHWPYVTSIDQEYNDPQNDNDPQNIFESDDQV